MSTKKSSSAKNISQPADSIEKETQSNVQKISSMEESAKAQRTFGEKVSEAIAAFCGSMVFVYVHIAWFGTWVIINSGFPQYSFDPFPYTFLTLVVSLEAIFLSTFILISQNNETRLAERRNHLDLQINMLAEQESTKTLELLQLIAEKVGVDCADPETKALLEPVDPETLVDQIISANGENHPDAKPGKKYKGS